MCLSVPAQVVEVVDREAQLVSVNVGGTVRVVNAAMLGGLPKSGEWLVVHAGIALDRLEPEDAERLFDLLDDLIQ